MCAMVNSVLYFGAVCWSGNINNQDRIRLYTFIKKANGKWDCKDGTGHGSWVEYRRFLADDIHSLRSNLTADRSDRY